MAISSSTTTAAIDALLKWKNKQSESNNLQLLPQDDFIYLILTLKKIPQKGGGARTNPNKIPLPHPLISPHSSEICLIIDDRPHSNLTSKIAKQKITSESIPVTKVIKLSKLKTDYKPFEAKRKLCDSYDMFFADKRVIPLLPKLLGKQFFKKKKLPLGVDLSHGNWKEQIERGCCSGLLWFRTGSCSVVRVAKVSMERDEIVENVRAAVDGVIGVVPRKMGGVRSLHLKFSDSVALPVYQSLPEIRLRIDGIGKKDEVMEIENSELVSGEVVEEDGGSDTKKRKGEGMEVGKKKRAKKGKVDEGSVGKDGKKSDKEKKKKGELVEKHDEDEVVVKAAKKSGKEKKKKGDLVEKLDDVSDDEGEVLEEVKRVKKSLKEKKRKGNVVEEGEVNAKSNEKVAKKKGKKQDGDSGKKEKKKGRLVSKV